MDEAVEWRDIESAASGIFSVWTSGGDLEFAQEAWKHLESAGLTKASTPFSRTRAFLLLGEIGLFYGEFSAAMWDENPGRSLPDRFAEIPGQRVMLPQAAPPSPGAWSI